jgi:hypothetical protein
MLWQEGSYTQCLTASTTAPTPCFAGRVNRMMLNRQLPNQYLPRRDAAGACPHYDCALIPVLLSPGVPLDRPQSHTQVPTASS